MRTPLKIVSEERYKELWPQLEDLSYEERVVVIRSRCYYDKEFFAQFVCTRWTSDKKTGKQYESPPFHRELWDLSSLGIDILCIVPRSFAKTTAMSKIDSLHALCFQTEQAILLIMSKGLGEEVIGDIRYEIETNKTIKMLFGNLIPTDNVINNQHVSGKKWRQRQLQLVTGVEIETVTKGEPVRGKRPTRVIVDDPQELKDVRNPRIAEEFNIWFWTTVYNALNPEESSIVILGTIISENCFVNIVRGEAEQKKIRVVEYKAIKDFDTKGFDGELLWPERWTKDMLKERYQKIGKDNFLQEFQNIARPFKGSFVLRNFENMKVIEPIGHFGKFSVFKDIRLPDLNFKQLHFGFDFSDGSADSDYQAIDCRNERGELIFQLRALIPQAEVVKEFDELISWIQSVRKFSIALNPETNYGQVFMDKAKKYSWFRFMRRVQVYDGFTRKERDEPGFKTTATSKLILVAALQDFIESNIEVSKIQYEEITKYVYDENQAMGALPGHHDDTVISAATACLSIKRGNPSDMTKFF